MSKMRTLYSHMHEWLLIKVLDFERWRDRNKPDPEDEEPDVINRFLETE